MRGWLGATKSTCTQSAVPQFPHATMLIHVAAVAVVAAAAAVAAAVGVAML